MNRVEHAVAYALLGVAARGGGHVRARPQRLRIAGVGARQEARRSGAGPAKRAASASRRWPSPAPRSARHCPSVRLAGVRCKSASTRATASLVLVQGSAWPPVNAAASAMGVASLPTTPASAGPLRLARTAPARPSPQPAARRPRTRRHVRPRLAPAPRPPFRAFFQSIAPAEGIASRRSRVARASAGLTFSATAATAQSTASSVTPVSVGRASSNSSSTARCRLR